MGLLDKLNDAQKEAVLHTDGPIMVMAGAGSGKTRVLTHRIAYLVKEIGIPLEDILAVTFTNKAAKEMKERVGILLEEEVQQTRIWVSTIHGLCFRILKLSLHLKPPFTNRFSILDENDSLSYVKRTLKALEMTEVFKDKEAKKLISKVKNGDVLSFRNDRTREKETAFDQIYHHYNHLLEMDNMVDFDDLIRFTIEIFKNNAHVLNYYQEKFQYIMVDEFQDTNYMQYELIKMFAMKHQNIFIVGDQDQSIYAFRGAKVENIDTFLKDFPLTKIILLEKNYRSTKGILNLANSVISQNRNRIPKNLFTDSEGIEKPFFYQGFTSYDEISFVLMKIEQLMKKYNYTYSDFAIMYRANYISRNLEDELVKRGLRYQIYGGMSYFSRMEVKDIVAYLSLVINQDNDFALRRIINVPKRKIGTALTTKLEIIAEEQKCSLFTAIDYLAASGIGYTNALAFKFTILELNDYIEKNALPDMIDLILDKSGYRDWMNTLGEEGEERLQNVLELKSILAEIDEEYEGTNLEKLFEITSQLALRTDMDKVDDRFDSIRLMTYHQAKGLEFKVVFMIAMEEGIFPSINCITPEDIEEERRICYVGVTRAMEHLFLTCAKIRTVFGVNQKQSISRFIDVESPLLNVERKRKKEITPIRSQTPSLDDKPFIFMPGDKIEHKTFGPGLVVQIDNPLIVVAFKAPYGVKKLNSFHPSITKL